MPNTIYTRNYCKVGQGYRLSDNPGVPKVFIIMLGSQEWLWGHISVNLHITRNSQTQWECIYGIYSVPLIYSPPSSAYTAGPNIHPDSVHILYTCMYCKSRVLKNTNFMNASWLCFMSNNPIAAACRVIYTGHTKCLICVQCAST